MYLLAGIHTPSMFVNVGVDAAVGCGATANANDRSGWQSGCLDRVPVYEKPQAMCLRQIKRAASQSRESF